MTDTDPIIPKELLQIIGTYARPKMYKVYLGRDNEFYIHAENESEIYKLLCSDDLQETLLGGFIKYICSKNQMCVLSGDEPPQIGHVNFMWKFKHWYRYKADDGYTMTNGVSDHVYEITAENLRQHKISPEDLEKLFKYNNTIIQEVITIK